MRLDSDGAGGDLVGVDDLQAYLDKAQTLGGKTLVPPVTIPEQGSFAWLADPDGNIVGLWKAQKAGFAGTLTP